MAKIGRPLDYDSPEQMIEIAQKYFDDCAENKRPITVTGTCIALGFTTRQALLNYEGRPEFVDAVKSIKAICENFAEEQSYISRNPAGPIFCLKNFGWRDQQDLKLSGDPENPLVVTVRHIGADE